ncbi:MAG: periplasmic heavy metal sensor [Desulfobacteraceae bacterium]|jgi:Spy/CpxP family protein refolding chaperone
MNRCGFLISCALIVSILISGIAFAGGSGGGGMGGMGSGNSGMMGGHMMSNPWQGQPGNQYPSYQYKQTETEKLREAIRQKRQELSDLYRSENPDKDQIDQKINELNKLEAELDRSLSGN